MRGRPSRRASTGTAPPGQPTDSDYRGGLPAARCGRLRRAVYPARQLLAALVVYLPLAVGGLALLFRVNPWLEALLHPNAAQYTTLAYYGVALGVSALFVGFLALGMLFVLTVPRLLNLALTPDVAYPLYGWRFSIHRQISRTTNRKLFHKMTGDSSFIALYLRAMGWRLNPLVQTGSNFGNEVKHENPYLSRVGSGTVCASDLSMVTARYSNTSFSVTEAAIGGENFLGNQIVYPPRGGQGTTVCSPRRFWYRSTDRSARASGCSAPPPSRSPGRSPGTPGSTTWRPGRTSDRVCGRRTGTTW